MIAALLAVCLAYWPCGAHGLGVLPVDGRVAVIDTVGVREKEAYREWNACGGLQFSTENDLTPYTPGTITIVPAKGGLPRGGISDGHGVVFLPPGGWTRAIPTVRHELGHAVGFNHTQRPSVMGSDNRVHPVDCEGLRRSY